MNHLSDGSPATYLRVSTEGQSGEELDNQRKLMAEFERRHGVTVPERFTWVDVGSRDETATRPDWQKMWDVLRRPQGQRPDWLWVERPDRFGTEDGEDRL